MFEMCLQFATHYFKSEGGRSFTGSVAVQVTNAFLFFSSGNEQRDRQ